MKAGTRKFEERWTDSIREIFPEWTDAGALFDLAMDVCQFSFEGMALNKLSHNSSQRQERMVQYIKSRVREMFEAASTGEHDQSVAEFIISHNTP